MRLTHIKLAGFKSFVDPTTLSLASTLTGVVGPNGCGKSNVIDAVRWVTGESSARQLRGESIEDVIFSGSNARKPVGRASVELKFDNSDGHLGGRYAGFGDISVRRELTRDSGSKYFINNTRARRRDVVDLFLGTGLGGRSNYAVIEQGAVNRLIEARPEEMRQVFEEAAGISKYKQRRRETENRIGHTRENLERLNDLISEVAQRLATLKRQAAEAEKYKTLKAEERRLRAELLTLRWLARSAEVETAEDALRRAESELRETMSGRRRADEAHTQVQHSQQAATADVQNRQAAFYDAQARAGHIQQALNHAREVEQMRQRERQALIDRLDALGTRRDDDQKADQTLIDTEAARRAEREQAETELADARQRFETAENQAAQAEAAWEALNNRDQNPLAQLEAERTRARYAEQQRRQMAERETARRAERERLPTIDQSALDAAERDLAAQQDRLAGTREKTAETSREADTLKQRIAEDEKQLAAKRARRAETQAELASERRTQQAVLREDDTAINDWLIARGYGKAEGIARRVRVREAFRLAAESALGDLLRGFAVDDLEPAGALEGQNGPADSVTLIDVAADIDIDIPKAPAGLVCLANAIDGPPAIRAAAASVFVADTLGAALAARHRLEIHQSVVTRQGCRIGPAGLSTPAGETTDQRVFEREQRITSLRDTFEALGAECADSDHALGARRECLERLRAQQSELDDSVAEQQRAIETARATLDGQRLRADQARERDAEIGLDLADLAEQREHARRHAEAAESRVAELEAEAERFAAARERARETLAANRGQRDRARSEAAIAERKKRELDSTLGELAMRRENLASRVADTQSAFEDVAAQLERFDAPASEANAPRDSYSADDLSAAREDQAAAERDLRSARKTLEARDSALADAAQKAMGAQQAVEAGRETLAKARVDVETAGVRRQSVVEQLAELGQTPAVIAKSLPEDADIDAWSQDIEAVERRITRLGAINLAAIEEYDEIAERETYLAGQRADLAQALATLEQAIAKIDRETRQRFKATYDQVNARFSKMFPQLFGGGSAALELTDEDWLATGVRVMARPPGKRNTSIQMLSGGEKALTAVALLFALFELNPAPFCMLDEIDAPLDDANVSRFCELVRTMSSQVQFIVITHNKLTMELVEQLHGVTMAESGVSRLVSVDIDQALDLAG